MPRLGIDTYKRLVYGACVKTVLSLFDAIGAWSDPYFNAGYDVQTVDLQSLAPLDLREIVDAETALEVFGSPDIILAAPPCTDFSVSGAQYWKAKDADGRTAASVEIARQVLRIVDLFQPTDDEYIAENGKLLWAVENPVGRMSKLLPEFGEPWYFDPCDYAGYLNPSPAVLAELDRIRAKNGDGVTSREADFVMEWNAYTKKTGLWGNFARPVKKRIEPVKVCRQGSPLQRKGGKGDDTKNYRSATPRGFAIAFFAANR